MLKLASRRQAKSPSSDSNRDTSKKLNRFFFASPFLSWNLLSTSHQLCRRKQNVFDLPIEGMITAQAARKK
jgi:hypothetical protein